MAVTKRELEYYLVQLRRIAEHREDGAEKEIRRIYRALLKDLKQFIGYEYAELAEDGRLTYSILQQKGEFARFLEEVEQRINNLSPQITSEITAAVEETYRIVYDGMMDAVKQNTESEGLKRALDGLRSATPETIKRAVENPVSGLTLKDTLEKNRRDIIYDIKRNVAVGLSNGDRVDTMAKRISQSLDGDYQKAVRIARTESHRVQEAGFHDSAAEVDSTLQNSDSGLRMVKTWRTMKDERVRPQRRYKTKSGWKTVRRGTANHQKMEGVSVLMDEQFDLGGGVKADAPGQSGVASHDINCRCFVEYDMMTDEEFFENTGKHFDGSVDKISAEDIIKTEKQFGKKVGKHASDWGLDPSSASDRAKLEQIIDDIILNHDQPVRIGEWKGQPEDVLFFIKGNDVVITKRNIEFITILKGGASNGRVKDARER